MGEWTSGPARVLAAIGSFAAIIAPGSAQPSGLKPIIEPGLARPPSADPRDLEGTYTNGGRFSTRMEHDELLTPAAKAVRGHRLDMQKKGTPVASPHVLCRPAGMISTFNAIFPTRVVQTPEKIVFFYEEVRSAREIDMASAHRKDLVPTYQGDSIAHWEGNTLVIDTIAFNDRTWLDNNATPHSDELHTIERFTKKPDGGLHLLATIEDPKTYVQPFTIERDWAWATGQRQLEDDCEENPSADQIAGLVYEDDYLKPVCESKAEGAEFRVVCAKPVPPVGARSRTSSK